MFAHTQPTVPLPNAPFASRAWNVDACSQPQPSPVAPLVTAPISASPAALAGSATAGLTAARRQLLLSRQGQAGPRDHQFHRHRQ